MSFGSRRSGRALLLAGASAALLAAVPGCSYLQWRHEKKEQRAELEKSPANLLLEKDYAPQDCFGLIGRIAIPKEQKSPLLVAAFAHASPPHEVNYTQTWVQGAVVVPMLATGFFVAAILWDKSLTTPEIARLHTYGQLLVTTWQYWPFPLAIMFFSTWLLSFCGIASLKNWGWLVALIAPVAP